MALIPLMLFWSSCSNTKYLSDNESMLVKTTINLEENTDYKEKRDLVDELENVPLQKSNKKALALFRLKLWFHNVSKYRVKQGEIIEKDTTKFRTWIQSTVGETPTIYDEDKAAENVGLMRNYMANKGYFYSDIQYQVITKKKKTELVYCITTNNNYQLDTITFPSGADHVSHVVRENVKSSYLKTGDPFDVSLLKKERDRIENTLRNAGYFDFKKNYVEFDLDSANGNNTINVYTKVRTPTDSTNHQQYFIDQVYIYTNYSVDQSLSDVELDTVQVDEYFFIGEKGAFSEKILMQSIFFRKDRIYREEDYQLTYKRLTDLGVFRFINISFKVEKKFNTKYLDCHIYMTPGKKQSFGVDLEANNNFDGLVGSAIAFNYKNRNLSKAADHLVFTAATGLEFQFDPTLPAINTADLSLGVDYYMNKFLLPFAYSGKPRRTNPKTRLSFKYNYERRFEFYTLNGLSFSFGYDWLEQNNKRHIYNPIAINLITLANKTQKFQDRLDEIPSLKSSFEEQIILGTNYTFIATSKENRDKKRSMYFKGNVDMAGNLAHTAALLANLNDNTSPPYFVLGRRYAQYIRFEGDGRYYLPLTNHSTLALRANVGVGVPYGNADVLPYIKQFYVGGANGIRAFRVRTIGPGGHTDTSSTTIFRDQTGDMKFETSAELRFDIFKWFKGAVFLDAGNVWTIQRDTSRIEGSFYIDQFYKEIAVGTGAGLRMDFDYFVIRMDLAFPIRNPSLPEGQRWIFNDIRLFDRAWRRDNIILNLAIGYPF